MLAYIFYVVMYLNRVSRGKYSTTIERKEWHLWRIWGNRFSLLEKKDI